MPKVIFFLFGSTAPLCTLASLMIYFHRFLSHSFFHHAFISQTLIYFNTQFSHLNLRLHFFLLPSLLQGTLSPILAVCPKDEVFLLASYLLKVAPILRNCTIQIKNSVHRKFVIIYNKYSKIPQSTSMHFATPLRRSRVVRLNWSSRSFMRAGASKLRASNSSLVSKSLF